MYCSTLKKTLISILYIKNTKKHDHLIHFYIKNANKTDSVLLVLKVYARDLFL